MRRIARSLHPLPGQCNGDGCCSITGAVYLGKILKVKLQLLVLLFSFFSFSFREARNEQISPGPYILGIVGSMDGMLPKVSHLSPVAVQHPAVCMHPIRHARTERNLIYSTCPEIMNHRMV